MYLCTYVPTVCTVQYITYVHMYICTCAELDSYNIVVLLGSPLTPNLSPPFVKILSLCSEATSLWLNLSVNVLRTNNLHFSYDY